MNGKLLNKRITPAMAVPLIPSNIVYLDKSVQDTLTQMDRFFKPIFKKYPLPTHCSDSVLGCIFMSLALGFERCASSP